MFHARSADFQPAVSQNRQREVPALSRRARRGDRSALSGVLPPVLVPFLVAFVMVLPFGFSARLFAGFGPRSCASLSLSARPGGLGHGQERAQRERNHHK